MNPRLILAAFLLGSALGPAQTIFVGGHTDPGTALTNNLMNAANWDNGLPVPDGDVANPGTIALDATWADPDTGGDVDIIDFDFTITGGATVRRGASFIAGLLGSTDIVIENGTLAPNEGPGTKSLQINEQSSITVDAMGTLNVGNANLKFGNTGTLTVNGGRVMLGSGWFRIKTNEDYAFLTFGAGNGTVSSNNSFDFQQGNVWISVGLDAFAEHGLCSFNSSFSLAISIGMVRRVIVENHVPRDDVGRLSAN